VGGEGAMLDDGGEEQMTVEKRKEQAESLRHCKTSHFQLTPSNGLPGAQ
jgi:hypothetical protein